MRKYHGAHCTAQHHRVTYSSKKWAEGCLVDKCSFTGGLWEVPVVPLQTFCLASESLICMVGILIYRILCLSLRCDSCTQLCYKSSEMIQSACTYYSLFIIHTI